MTQIPQHPVPAVQRLLDEIFWQTPADECMYCSDRRHNIVGATHEFWFTLSGDMLDDDAPHSVCHRVCGVCADQVRQDEARLPSDGLELVAERPL